MSGYKTIETSSYCIWCGLVNTGFKFTCRDCTKLLPEEFYNDELFRKFVPNHIPEEQRNEVAARRIIKYLKERE